MHGHVRTESNQMKTSTAKQPVLNPRIAAIVDQSRLYAYSKNPEEDSYGRTLNKAKYDIDYNNMFAELMIAECTRRVNQYIDDCVAVLSLPSYVLADHFRI